MKKKPTMEEVAELVEFGRDDEGCLFVRNIKGHVMGDVERSVWGNVGISVKGTIGGREWEFIETKKEKVIRLIREGRGEEAIDVLEISGVCGD